MRRAYALIALLGIAVSSGLFEGAFSYFKGQEIERATARLSLYRNTLESEIRHFGHVPFILSLDPVVAQTLAGGSAETL